VDVRDLACFGRPARLVWSKRRWRCRDVDCPVKTWTERSAHVPARAVLTCRAGIEACRQVGELARPVSGVADELGVCWWTVMHAVEAHGRPLVDDPRSSRARHLPRCRRDLVLEGQPEHPTVYATGLVDLEGKKVIDMVEGNAAETCADGAPAPTRMVGRREGRRHRPGGVLPGRPQPAPRPCRASGRSVPCRESRHRCSTPCADACRTNSSATGEGRTTPSIASESFFSRRRAPRRTRQLEMPARASPR